MAASRKYAGLPDLDLAPDVYETPELTDNASTINPSTTRSDSRASTDDDREEGDDSDENERSGISRTHINTDSARSRFGRKRPTGYAARIDGQRSLYRSSGRRKQGLAALNSAGDEEELSDGADEDSDNNETNPEGLRRRIARLMREAEELKVEAERQRQEKDPSGAQDEEDVKTDEALDRLNNIIRSATLSSSHPPSTDLQGATARLLAKLKSKPRPLPAPKSTSTASNGAEVGEDQPSPEHSASRRLPTDAAVETILADTQSAIRSISTRISSLEDAIGIPSLPVPSGTLSSNSGSALARDASTDDPTGRPQPGPILPTLALLERQIAIVTSTTPASLEAMAKRVRALNAEADALVEKRRALNNASAALLEQEQRPGTTVFDADGRGGRSSGGRPFASSVSSGRPVSSPVAAGADSAAADGSEPDPLRTMLAADPELISRIQSLYRALPAVERMAPVVPSLVERLRALRGLHADAAGARERLATLENRGNELARDITRWEGALHVLEDKMVEAEKRQGENAKVIEGWVRNLEERARAMGLGTRKAGGK